MASQKRIAAFSPETARDIIAEIERLRLGNFETQRGSKKPIQPPTNYIYVRNDSGEAIPAFACMQATGTVEYGGQNYVTVDKPADGDTTSGGYLFNFDREIGTDDADKYGIATAGPFFKVKSSSPSSAAGTRYAPQSGSWSVAEDTSGLICIAGPDDIGGDVMRAFLYGAGSSGAIIEFTILEDDYAESGSGECADASAGVESITASVTSRPCGVDRVPFEDDDGNVTVHDRAAGGFLEGRSAADVSGKGGFAALLESESGYNCEWVVIWMNWFVEIQVVTDVIISGTGITIERKNVKVWSECDLPPEVIEGTDCEAVSY